MWFSSHIRHGSAPWMVAIVHMSCPLLTGTVVFARGTVWHTQRPKGSGTHGFVGSGVELGWGTSSSMPSGVWERFPMRSRLMLSSCCSEVWKVAAMLASVSVAEAVWQTRALLRIVWSGMHGGVGSRRYIPGNSAVWPHSTCLLCRITVATSRYRERSLKVTLSRVSPFCTW
jgi:hypothetical protein